MQCEECEQWLSMSEQQFLSVQLHPVQWLRSNVFWLALVACGAQLIRFLLEGYF